MPVKKILILLSSIVLAVCLLLIVKPSTTSADELDDINKQLSQLNSDLNKSIAATKPLEGQLNSMQKQVENIKQRVGGVESGIVVKKQEIDNGYKRLAEKEKLISQTIRDFYVTSYYDSPLLIFMSLDNAFDVTQALAYQRAKTKQDKAIITNIALSLTTLEKKKADLLDEQKSLVVLKANLDEQSKKLDGVVKGAKNFQGELSGKIAALSAKQQEILSAKSGNSTFTIGGGGESADELLASKKGFSDSAPGGTFGVFSFGAYTHRKGMSQYGARGRAQSGQDFKTILKAYYGKDPVSKDTGGNLKVAGFGEMDFETTYLYGIAEMPSSWHPEALKAQAVAARTYAYRYKVDGKEICTNEACQVFNKGKSDNPPDSWKNAVNETKGQILEDVVTYYASTHGGYASPIGWDTTDGAGGGNFIEKAWEKTGGSPWLYKAWWRQGYSNSSSTCGRSTPWLSSVEMADIINAARFRDDRVTPVTTSCWGGNPYSMDELRAKANGPSSVSGASVLQGNGSSSEVVFQTNIGEIRLSASTFKEAFNLRAPGYVRIPQTGFAFFNIEQK
ncbi:MAG TPA: SpoIID/LytB domain-containing protein [Candidatus Limnocylindrales bacterium]|nr:SpoIID/LytB domain-containing protein [Candidatus Limnocylindrales bacterium]